MKLHGKYLQHRTTAAALVAGRSACVSTLAQFFFEKTPNDTPHSDAEGCAIEFVHLMDLVLFFLLFQPSRHYS